MRCVRGCSLWPGRTLGRWAIGGAQEGDNLLDAVRLVGRFPFDLISGTVVGTGIIDGVGAVVEHVPMSHLRVSLRRWILSPRADLVMSCVGGLIAGVVFSYVAVTTALEGRGYGWLLPAGFALGALVVGSLPVPFVRKHAEGARRLLGVGLALGLLLVGLSGSNPDLAIALLLALAGPAWALWVMDRMIATAGRVAEDLRHTELMAAVQGASRQVVTGPRVAGWRRS